MTWRLPADDMTMQRWQRGSFAAGVVASVLYAVWGFFEPVAFFRSYLTPYFLLLGLGLGSLALVMIRCLTGGAWGALIRPSLEAQMRTLPILALMFIPIACGLRYIYRWADPATRAEALHGWLQPWWLETGFFGLRALIYFAIWLTFAALLGRWFGRKDAKGDEKGAVEQAARCFSLSGPGLVLFGFCLHFAGIDWWMSLQTESISTMVAPKIFGSQILSAFALAVLLAGFAISPRDAGELRSKSVLNDLGGLLFTFLILWAYMVWFEYMLMWSADLPSGSVWIVPRQSGGWLWLALAVVIFNFAVPFFLLLFRAVKRSPERLARVALLIFVMQYVYIYGEVLPGFGSRRAVEYGMDVLAPVGLGGLWLAGFLAALRAAPAVSRYDVDYPHLLELSAADREIEEREMAEREEVVAHG